MTYEVRLSRRAVSDLEAIYDDKSVQLSPPAATWYLGLRDLIFSLEVSPYRGTIARDKPTLRQLLYGNKPHIYRILYTVDEPSATVNIAQVRHGARKQLR
jgi:toxin ParE1/3/4